MPLLCICMILLCICMVLLSICARYLGQKSTYLYSFHSPSPNAEHLQLMYNSKAPEVMFKAMEIFIPNPSQL